MSFAQRFTQWLGTLRGGTGDAATAAFPVRVAGLDFTRMSNAPARVPGFDQALVWVAVALLAFGLVMVYSASIAMPDNPRFARYLRVRRD